MSVGERLPAPPASLSAAGKRLWRGILRTYPIDDLAHLSALGSSLASLDRAEECRRLIKESGLLVADRYGQRKINPLVAAERDARAGFLTGLRFLGLDPNLTNGK